MPPDAGHPASTRSEILAKRAVAGNAIEALPFPQRIVILGRFAASGNVRAANPDAQGR